MTIMQRIGMITPNPISSVHPSIPPSFADAPFTYGFALLADLLASTICLAVLLRIITEARRMRDAELIVTGRSTRSPAPGRFTLLSANSLLLCGFLATIILRAAPDAAWMLALDEVSKSTISFLFRLDYSLDFAALWTLMGSVILWSWTRQSSAQQLHKVHSIPLPKLGWPVFRELFKITGLVTIASILITAGKALA